VKYRFQDAALRLADLEKLSISAVRAADVVPAVSELQSRCLEQQSQIITLNQQLESHKLIIHRLESSFQVCRKQDNNAVTSVAQDRSALFADSQCQLLQERTLHDSTKEKLVSQASAFEERIRSFEKELSSLASNAGQAREDARKRYEALFTKYSSLVAENAQDDKMACVLTFQGCK
jgi:hypothetical protein